MSITHGFNAPEFFDKTLFRKFIEQLQHNNVIKLSLTNKIIFDDKAEKAAEEAFKVLSAETRHSIHQTTLSKSAIKTYRL